MMVNLPKHFVLYTRIGTLLCLSIVAPLAQPQRLQPPPPSATARLGIKGGVNSFHAGEPIQLEITFRSSETNCYVVSDTNPSAMDTVELTPEQRAYRWQQGNGPGSDAGGWGKLEAGQPSTFVITLNDLYRFDEGGEYKVQVRTRHLHCGVYPEAFGSELVTNPVSVHVTLFTTAEERDLANSLEQRIRDASKQHEAELLAKQLDYLPGDDATRAKISLTLHPKLFYPFGIDVTKGLWIARNRGMILSALEAAIEDPSIFVGPGLIQTLVQLQRNTSRPQSTCCVMAVSDDNTLTPMYMHRLALSLPRRSGDNLVDAALTVFEANARKTRTPQAEADFSASREILIMHFGEINEYRVGALLNVYGQQFEDRRLLPALHKLAENSTGIFSGNRSAAFTQIRKILPNSAQ